MGFSILIVGHDMTKHGTDERTRGVGLDPFLGKNGRASFFFNIYLHSHPQPDDPPSLTQSALHSSAPRRLGAIHTAPITGYF